MNTPDQLSVSSVVCMSVINCPKHISSALRLYIPQSISMYRVCCYFKLSFELNGHITSRYMCNILVRSYITSCWSSLGYTSPGECHCLKGVHWLWKNGQGYIWPYWKSSLSNQCILLLFLVVSHLKLKVIVSKGLLGIFFVFCKGCPVT